MGIDTQASPGILFCDVVGSTRLYRDLGDDDAHAVIATCLAGISAKISAVNGRIIKTIGDEIMAIFPDALATYDAAVAIQRDRSVEVGRMSSDRKDEVHFRIGFHCGSVVICDGDAFGTTVNIAARLASLAKADQIITTDSAIEHLDTLRRATTRPIPAHARGLGDDVNVVEVVWHSHTDSETVIFHLPGTARSFESAGVLKIISDGRRWVFGPECESVTLGRHAENSVVIPGEFASRRHATIERRWDKWILIDHSTNGTFVRPAGIAEFRICREEVILRAAGSLSFGRSSKGSGGADVDFVLISDH
ncbi:adenylate/guanylate cyclase domain-containing protein [Methylobacterium symbioticum]|uniref:pH-sensitive adenylate cyclase n=1 Tax=Methylobacterium symbioticum TaxID=2584084 RepID=A0A509E5W2_9HYPH|nr:adenylate/guanylate cyclase domain-containing protein [Methylobacterium symbioticum]VUD69540.1 pH-sensitive adenylate cyclase [Methylobacterium symbioticum]